jgi:hypothetical protein
MLRHFTRHEAVDRSSRHSKRESRYFHVQSTKYPCVVASSSRHEWTFSNLTAQPQFVQTNHLHKRPISHYEQAVIEYTTQVAQAPYTHCEDRPGIAVPESRDASRVVIRPLNAVLQP